MSLDRHDRTRLRAPLPGELVPNTQEHFLATVRGACVSARAVGVVYRGKRPLRVVFPPDGVWMLDGLAQAPGADAELHDGNVVVYHPTTAARDEAGEVDDRPVGQVAAIGLFDRQGRHGAAAGPLAALPGDQESLDQRLAAFRRATGRA